MNFNLFLVICGWPLVVIASTLSVGLSAGAIFLAARSRKPDLLASFAPLCWLPLFSAIGISFFGFLSSIGIQMDAEEGTLVDAGVVLSMNLLPLLFGTLASVVPFLTTTICRWKLVLDESEIEWFAGRTETDEDNDGFDPEAWVDQEAEDYLEKLVRPR